MSLINEMLRDLDKRKNQGKKSPPSNENPVTVGTETSSLKPLLFGGGVLLLVAAIWLAITLIPGSLPLPHLPQKPSVDTTTVAEKDAGPAVETSGAAEEKQQSMAMTANKDRAAEVSANKESTLLGLEIGEAGDTARLSLTFAQLPAYRLLQNGVGQAQLVVSFDQTQIGEDFEIPTLTGMILQRVSLLPQKQTLQLLVDLKRGAQVQSFQLIEDADQGYRLLIEFVGAEEAIEKSPEKISVPEEKPQVAEISHEPIVAEKEKISKNKKVLSRDQQAYHAGLEHLQQKEWSAAEESFDQALTLNPKLLDARLRLIGLLQQQMQLDKAEHLLQQSLQLNPENPDLRKVYARLMLKDQRFSTAIKLLKSEPVPAVASDLEYHALLAALFQESKQFEAASQVYGYLLQVRPQAALWWMGLAISQEQLGKSEQARNAYQRAINLPGLRPELRNYIQSRLQVL